MTRRLSMGLGVIPESTRAAPTAAPVNVVLPSVSGILTQGQTLTANPGSWTGTPSGAYGYQWQRSGANIGGATASTYVAQAADVAAGASAITVEVTATNDIGSTTAESAGVTIAGPLAVSGTPPAATVGVPYSFTFTSSGGHGPKTWALTGTLQAGLDFDETDGEIFGTPLSTGTASGLDATVTDADGLTASRGSFSLVVGTGELAAPSRPTSPALAATWNTTGDSTAYGVGAPTNFDWPKQAQNLFGSGTIYRGGQSGQDTTYIKNYVLGGATTQGKTIGSTERGQPWIFGGGLNDYGISGIVNWPATVKTNVGLMAAALTGGVDWFHMIIPVEWEGGPGQRHFADYAWHARDMIATYGRHAIDQTKWLLDQGQTTPGGADAFMVSTRGNIPMTFRGGGSAIDGTVENTLPPTEAVTTNLVYPNAGKFWYSVSLTYYIHQGSSGAGSNTVMDAKHFNQIGQAAQALLAFDVINASQGTGAPFASPFECKVAKDVAAGAICDAPYTGAADAVQFMGASGSPAECFSVALATASYSGETHGVVRVSRTGTGTLVEGETILTIRLQGAGRTLDSKIRVYVGRPSTQTSPQKLAIASPGIGLGGRWNHGFADGDKVSLAAYVNLASSAAGGQILSFTAHSGGTSAQLNWGFNTSGSLNLSARANDFSLIANGGFTHGLGSSDWAWFLISLDWAGATANLAYKNETSRTLSPGLTADASIPFSKLFPLFLSTRSPKGNNDGLGNLVGGLGNIIVFPGYVDWSNAANRRALFANDASFTPATRTPYSAVGGVTPVFDIQGGVGDILWGSTDAAASASLILPSHNARTLLTAV